MHSVDAAPAPGDDCDLAGLDQQVHSSMSRSYCDTMRCGEHLEPGQELTVRSRNDITYSFDRRMV
jgi:hypothetical protein